MYCCCLKYLQPIFKIFFKFIYMLFEKFFVFTKKTVLLTMKYSEVLLTYSVRETINFSSCH